LNGALYDKRIRRFKDPWTHPASFHSSQTSLYWLCTLGHLPYSDEDLSLDCNHTAGRSWPLSAYILSAIQKGGRSREISLTEDSLTVIPSWQTTATCVETSRKEEFSSSRVVLPHYQFHCAGNVFPLIQTLEVLTFEGWRLEVPKFHPTCQTKSAAELDGASCSFTNSFAD
jgi:hypothetical protein